MNNIVVNPDKTGDLAELLSSIPVKNQSVEVGIDREDEITLYVPLKKKWFMRPPVSWILPIHDKRGVSLDKLGKEVWDYCDDKKTVEEIIDLFSQKHHISFHESRSSVVEFLRLLTRRGLIVIMGSPKRRV